MKYTGMTVNGRLYVSGKLSDYDKAIREQDINKVKEILKSVELNDVSIIPILQHDEFQTFE
jgi:hypothetical protein